MDDVRGTPLHEAWLARHLEVVQELLKYKPNINAVSQGVEEMIPLMCAAQIGSIEIVEELLKHGADINFNDPKSGSALHQAMKHEEIVKILLKNGCNTTRAELTYEGDDLPECTPFEMALDMKSIKIVKMIAFHET